MNFKEQLKEDHNIDNKVVNIIIDKDLLKEKKAKNAEGTYLGDLLFSIKADDLGYEPVLDQHMKFDGDIKRIIDFQENSGMYIITLGANMS